MALNTAGIQALLDKTGIVTIPDGIYNIGKTLILKSNTTLIMSPNVNLVRNFNGPVLGTAPGSENIKVEGGVIIGKGPNIYATTYGNLTYTFKSKNVTFRDVIFKDTLGSHSIEINSSKDVSVLNCKFLGHKMNPSGEFREAIQIDFAATNTLPEYPVGSPYYDLECCDNIKIIGCVFDKSDKYPAPLNAIGTHSQPNSSNKHTRILIANNIAKGDGIYGSYGFFVHCVNFKDVQIINNIVEDYARFVRIYSNEKEYKKNGASISNGYNSYCENIKIAGNTVRMYEDFKSTGVYAISKNGIRHKNIQIINNTFLADGFGSESHYIVDLNNCDTTLVALNTCNMEFLKPIRYNDTINNKELIIE